jgi:N-acetylmuramoyl-L-alanine amidase
MDPRLRQVFAMSALLPAMAAANSGIIRVTSIQALSRPGSTRVILRTTGPVEYRSHRAFGPDRLFFDIQHSSPSIGGRPYATREIRDGVVNRVRIAETAPGTTRLVFDLAVRADFEVIRLEEPERILIEIRPERRSQEQRNQGQRNPDQRNPDRLNVEQRNVDTPPRLASVVPTIPPVPYRAEPYQKGSTAPNSTLWSRSRSLAFVFPPAPAIRTVAVQPAPPLASESSPAPAAVVLPQPVLPGPVPPQRYARTHSTRILSSTRTAAIPPPARLPDSSARSLTRALGLKINRIVIDAGHGGHDDGTIGPDGVLEKDVVLDVALRLGALLQNRMGAEVILTRSDDTFVPLHERTAIANEHKADLFLSIHANSSPSRLVGGTETFFLNFTNNPTVLDVATRENAGSDKSVGELKDLIQSITLNDKITESQAFARDIQSSLFAQAAKSNSMAHDRGVKRAPFVVLIGASMPSVLAEIGFLSNSRDENNLSKPEYRQKIAEALFRGVSQYAKSLSHFEVASGSLSSIAGDSSRY